MQKRDLNKRSRLKEEEELIDKQLKEAGLWELGQSLEEKKQLLQFITDSETSAKDEEYKRQEVEQMEHDMISKLCNNSQSLINENENSSPMKNSPSKEKENVSNNPKESKPSSPEPIAGPSSRTSDIMDVEDNSNPPSFALGSPLRGFEDVERFKAARESRSSSVECDYIQSAASPDRDVVLESDDEEFDLMSYLPKDNPKFNDLDKNIESPIIGRNKGSIFKKSITNQNKIENNVDNVILNVKELPKEESNSTKHSDSIGLVGSKVNNEGNEDSPDIVESTPMLIENEKNKDSSIIKNTNEKEGSNFIPNSQTNNYSLKTRRKLQSEKDNVFFRLSKESHEECVNRILKLLNDQSESIASYQLKLPPMSKWGRAITIHSKLEFNSLDRPSVKIEEANSDPDSEDDNVNLFDRVTRSRVIRKTYSKNKQNSDIYISDDSDFFDNLATNKSPDKKIVKKDVNLCLNLSNKTPEKSNNKSVNSTNHEESLKLVFSGDSDNDSIMHNSVNRSKDNCPVNSSTPYSSVVEKKQLNESVPLDSPKLSLDLDEDSHSRSKDNEKASKAPRKTFQLGPDTRTGVDESATPSLDKEDSLDLLSSIKDQDSKRKRIEQSEEEDSGDDVFLSKRVKHNINLANASKSDSQTKKKSDVPKPAPVYLKKPLQNNSKGVKSQPSTQNGETSNHIKENNVESYPSTSNDEPTKQMIECPLCLKQFSEKEIQVHASDCNGPSDDIEIEDTPPRKTRDQQTSGNSKENLPSTSTSNNVTSPWLNSKTITLPEISKPYKKGPDKEQCFYCGNYFSHAEEYFLHTRTCTERETLFGDQDNQKSSPKTPIMNKKMAPDTRGGSYKSLSLFQELDRHRGNSSVLQPLHGNLKSPHVKAHKRKSKMADSDDEYEFPTSPIRNFVPISQQTDSLINYQNLFRGSDKLTKLGRIPPKSRKRGRKRGSKRGKKS